MEVPVPTQNRTALFDKPLFRLAADCSSPPGLLTELRSAHGEIPRKIANPSTAQSARRRGRRLLVRLQSRALRAVSAACRKWGRPLQ
jgi:hypothetical protein